MPLPESISIQTSSCCRKRMLGSGQVDMRVCAPNAVEGWALERSGLGPTVLDKDGAYRTLGLKYCSVCTVQEIHLEENGAADNRSIEVLY